VTSDQQCNADNRSPAFPALGVMAHGSGVFAADDPGHDPLHAGCAQIDPWPGPVGGPAGRACAGGTGGSWVKKSAPGLSTAGSGPAASSAAPRPTRRRRVPRPRCRYLPVMSVTRLSRSPRSVLYRPWMTPGPVRGLTAPSPGATAPNAAHLQPAGHSTRRDGSGGGGEPKCSGGCGRLGVKPVH